jgi:hypothetical protein
MLKGTSTKQKARLTISESKEFVEMRGLTSTAGMFVDVYPCSAIYAGKTLKKRSRRSYLSKSRLNTRDKLKVVMAADFKSQTDGGAKFLSVRVERADGCNHFRERDSREGGLNPDSAVGKMECSG